MSELNHDPIFVAVVIALLGFLIGMTKGGFNTLGALLTPVLSLVLPVSTAVGVLLPMLIVGEGRKPKVKTWSPDPKAGFLEWVKVQAELQNTLTGKK